MSNIMIIDEIRQDLQTALIKHLEETEDETWCKCDVCTVIRLNAEDESLIRSLARIGLGYLLGENFNCMAALNYYKRLDNQDDKIAP